MSVIGTTYKQPRVLAHDAVALKDLPSSIYRPIDRLEIVPWEIWGKAREKLALAFIKGKGKGINPLYTIPGTGGTEIDFREVYGGKGFVKDEIYRAITTGAEGTVFDVRVISVNSEGAIRMAEYVTPECKSEQSTNLNNGELFNVMWSPRADQGVDDGESAVNMGAVILKASEPWEFGAPINPAIEDLESDISIDLPLHRMQDYFRKKQIVKYTYKDCVFRSMPEGSSLYVGIDLKSIRVVMESGKLALFSNVSAGSFLPILALTVVEARAANDVVIPDGLTEVQYIYENVLSLT
jgi:hypothetical protein